MFLPEVSMGSIMPVISASPDPQIWYTGSAVDQETMEDGVAFARQRERAIEGESDRLAYFEWSLDADAPGDVEDDVAGDPVSWAATNPAFGVRIRESYLKEERENLDSRTFAVERLGVGDWPATSDSSLISLELWSDLIDGQSSIEGPAVFAFDVRPDRSGAVIAAAGKRADGLFHVETVDRRHGTKWVVPRILELTARHDQVGVFCDLGPAGSLLPGFEDVEVTVMSAREMAQACGLFYDTVEQAGLRHLGTPEILSALRGAQKRDLGDAWAWSRKNSAVDIGPLVAVTIALWGASTVRKAEVFASAW
jgi:hypothetical protein